MTGRRPSRDPAPAPGLRDGAWADARFGARADAGFDAWADARFDVVIDADLAELGEGPTGPIAFEARVRPPHGPGWRLAAGGLAAALAIAVGAGALGAPRRIAPPPAPLGIAPLGVAPAVTLEVVRLLEPGGGSPVVTTQAVGIEGSIRVRAARVEVSLEARGNRVLDSVGFDTTDPSGGIRPDGLLGFTASFGLPFPRSNGTMWVVVTAFDASGLPLGGVRRPFVVGPLVPGSTGRTPSLPTPV